MMKTLILKTETFMKPRSRDEDCVINLMQFGSNRKITAYSHAGQKKCEDELFHAGQNAGLNPITVS